MNVVEMSGMTGRTGGSLPIRCGSGGRHTGTGVSVDVLAVLRRHLQGLLAAGAPLAGIALHCGVNRKTIQWVVSGRAEAGIPPGYRVDPVHARRILALRLQTLHPGCSDDEPVPAVGTVRRLRALVAAGHSDADIAAHLGVAAQLVTNIVEDGPDTVPAALARSAATLFQRLEMTTGGCQDSRDRAAESQWAPPLAWDIEVIDRPKAKPDFGATPRRPRFLATYMQLRGWGFSDVRIAEHMGVQASSLLRQLIRYELPASEELTSLAGAEKRRARKAAS